MLPAPQSTYATQERNLWNFHLGTVSGVGWCLKLWLKWGENMRGIVRGEQSCFQNWVIAHFEFTISAGSWRIYITIHMFRYSSRMPTFIFVISSGIFYGTSYSWSLLRQLHDLTSWNIDTYHTVNIVFTQCQIAPIYRERLMWLLQAVSTT